MAKQITSEILMIRPKHFRYNTQTAINNSFQIKPESGDEKEIQALAIEEFDKMVVKLRTHGINIITIEDTSDPLKPDAIFPNNWVSFHENKVVITYPMFAENRRMERREDIIDQISEQKGYNRRYNFEFYESEGGVFLEGTGSMILDRVNKIVYACISPRTSIKVLDKFCVLMGYQKQIFHAYDDQNELIYHTNVMMALGNGFAVICLDSITDKDERIAVKEKLESSGKEIIDISMEQMNHYAGNMLQVKSNDMQDYVVMSKAAYDSLTTGIIDQLNKHTKTIVLDIPTIEKYGGGSVRCMMAELF